eukprot:Opistho-2@8349
MSGRYISSNRGRRTGVVAAVAEFSPPKLKRRSPSSSCMERDRERIDSVLLLPASLAWLPFVCACIACVAFVTCVTCSHAARASSILGRSDSNCMSCESNAADLRSRWPFTSDKRLSLHARMRAMSSSHRRSTCECDRRMLSSVSDFNLLRETIAFLTASARSATVSIERDSLSWAIRCAASRSTHLPWCSRWSPSKKQPTHSSCESSRQNSSMGLSWSGQRTDAAIAPFREDAGAISCLANSLAECVASRHSSQRRAMHVPQKCSAEFFSQFSHCVPSVESCDSKRKSKRSSRRNVEWTSSCVWCLHRGHTTPPSLTSGMRSRSQNEWLHSKMRGSTKGSRQYGQSNAGGAIGERGCPVGEC